MPITDKTVAAVVVTYNRKALLERCLTVLSQQTRLPNTIIIVDNASMDGTSEMLAKNGWLDRTGIEIITMTENLGGAGGFARGIKYAIEMEADFCWVMDDDALPELDALEELLLNASDDGNLYGSVAVAQDNRLSWRLSRTDIIDKNKRNLQDYDSVPQIAPVEFLPFLGLLISRRLVQHIGLPDEGFFLAADDVDFCCRAHRVGASIFAIGSSRLNHPAAELYSLQLPWLKLWSLKLPPWKRYYDVRNRLFVARNHYGWALYYQTIPGSILRLIGTLLYEKQRVEQIKAFWGGMVDGLLNRKGRRHELWGL